MNAPPPISERRASETTGGAMMLIRLRCAVLAVALGACAPSALCQDLIVAKRIFELPSYSTVGNATIRNLKIGWEAAGTLNADKSNAILITHYFSGTSHAFGKYAAGDNAAGYWDSIIGPGKPIDTDKYYVISSDTLVNLNVNAPNVMTTGPASIDPGTGKPYGMSFPVVSIKDFVRVQKALIDSLGVKKLKAVVGASMGGLQAYEWAASYPEMVERIIPVIATPGPDLYLIAWLGTWAQPILLDPKWNGGDYYGKEPPLEGLKTAFRVATLQAFHYEWADKTFRLGPADADKDPRKAWGNKFKVEAELDALMARRAATVDANHFLYLVKANQLASADVSKIKAPTFAITTPSDAIFYPARVEEALAALRANGTAVEIAEVTGPNGHWNGVFSIAQAGDKIRAFLK
jgi:homoserine O-acetyltransferase/O-succinyltransferase